MPRATFAGVTFDLLVEGLEDRHEGFTSVRSVPGSTGSGSTYVDLGGAMLQRRSVTIKLDSEANYNTLKALPGTSSASGTLVSAEGSHGAVLVSLTRYWRKGTGVQLCRTEWVFTS